MPAAAAWINPSVETNEIGTPGVVSLSELPMPVFALLIGVKQGSTNLRLRFASHRHGSELPLPLYGVRKTIKNQNAEAGAAQVSWPDWIA